MSVHERRSALIEAAYRVIADHGVEGATTRRICAHANMPLASFHYAFDSRTALLCAVMDTAVPSDINRMLESILPMVVDEGQGREAMQKNMRSQLEAFYSLLKADPGRMQATISLGIYAHNHAELQRVGKQMYERLYEVATLGLDASAQRAAVRWRTPVESLGPVIIAATNAITLTYLSTSDDDAVGTIIEASTAALMTYVTED
ncbi:TetR family transcriptional regulator [Gordonia sp. ABSL11-1]|uniref:TetR/AcrR family transcriptional regulator n=1 Tax=Gordonia sp. ABSL11-1 TaxID=3053924 RepID=UPI002572B225|nr:TetR family transcriptional regulator [Gordonia sp. ABSL11-1]MDL9948808.1 TetR family transcriptional regulator [Gordonia sp. ABSL11-1]